MRVFTEAIGETPQASIIKTRLQRAQRLLADSSLPVGEVAAMLGYSNPCFFSRQFRKKVVCTPTDYRMTCRREAHGEQRG